MKAIILAAGRGSRMKSRTDKIPKCLINFMNKPLIEWQIQALKNAGISDIAVVSGYMHDKLRYLNLKEFYNIRWAETNMVSSLECADSWLSCSECIISYSDIYYQADAILKLAQSNESLAITYDKNWRSLWEKRFKDPLSDAESFKIDDQEYLLEIGQKETSINNIQGQYMGLIKFTPNSWEILKALRQTLKAEVKDKMHMTNTLNLILQKQLLKIKAISFNGIWAEFDSAEDLNFVNNSLQN